MKKPHAAVLGGPIYNSYLHQRVGVGGARRTSTGSTRPLRLPCAAPAITIDRHMATQMHTNAYITRSPARIYGGVKQGQPEHKKAKSDVSPSLPLASGPGLPEREWGGRQCEPRVVIYEPSADQCTSSSKKMMIPKELFRK